MWTVIALIATLIFLVFYKANVRPPGFPPGPFVWPLFGNALSMMKSPKIFFTRLQKEFGDVVSIKVFDRWTVLLSDPGLMKSAGAENAVSGRIPELLLFAYRNQLIRGNDSPEPLGIIGTSGDVWRHQRRFTLRTLKDLGFGRQQSIEPVMRSEVEELLALLKTKDGEKLDIGLLFNRSIVNVIWAITIGKRFSHTDVRLEDLVNKVNRMLQNFNPFHPMFRFRIIRKLFPNLEVFQKTDGYMKDFLAFIEGEMDNYEKDYADVDDCGSFIGAYLKEMKEAKEEGKESPHNLEHLKANVMELFLAGSETTSSTLWWAIYLLATNPKIQRAIQKELDETIGHDNVPTLDHIDRLPYTTAAIYEVQRVSDLVPFAVPHQTLEDTSIAGYKIPEGTRVMFNLSHSLKDGKFWDHPDEFRPEHFLTSEGKPYKPEAFLPFGTGKRVCLGESLARLELFFFLTSLVHRFTWEMTDDPVTWESHTILSRPPKFTVIPRIRTEDYSEALKP